ncbi:response regulator [Microbulbifer halophilus]|uniref:Response regulator n=1 Tax=Microbulbifer halophilus TaxID=453963 RepID=A0ABW5EBA0_9GAMM|nr:response regulator transcription factor [Microbulbifer halophilus]MCW8127569.1 response regulator transcription factor [Microbulbifer halophilus]
MKMNIVIADGHEVFRQGLQSLIKSLDTIDRLFLAGDGQETWDIIKREKPDLAILEVNIRGIGGIDIARKIDLYGYPTQVIILTSCEAPLVAMTAREAGASGYVLKHSPFDSLLRALQTVQDGGTFTDPKIRTKISKFHRQGGIFSPLSPRETEVARLISTGNSSKQIARLLNVSPRTVDTYRDRLMKKISANNLSEVVRFTIMAGLIE